MAGLDVLSEDTGAPAAADPPASIPAGATGVGRMPAASTSAQTIADAAMGVGLGTDNGTLNRIVGFINQGVDPGTAAARVKSGEQAGALSTLDPLGAEGTRLMRQAVDPDMAARAYSAGALTPGNFGASMRGALTELNQAKKDEADLKMRYIPIVENALKQRLANQMGMRQQDLQLGTAALGAVAPFLNSQQPLTKAMMGQVLANAVQTGRTDMPHAQQLYGTLPDDPDELRRHLTGQVQAAVDPFGQHQTKLSAGQSLVNPLTGQTTAQSKNYKVQEVTQGDKITMVAVNLSDPTDQKVIGSYAVGSSPDAQLQYKASMYGHSVTDANNKATQEIERVKADPYGTLGLNKNVSSSAAAGAGLSGDDFLKTLPPNLAAQVKAMSDGRLQISPNQRSPQQQQLIQLAMQYEPGTDQTTYLSRAATTKDAATGTLAKSNNALNTLAGHLAELHESAAALHNTSIPWVNGFKNWALDALGDPRLKAFHTNAHGVEDEFEKVYRNSGGTQAGIDEWKKNLADANSPEQFQAVLAMGANMVESKLEANNAQHAQGMSGKVGSYSSITPKAQAAFDKIRGVKPTAAATATPTATPTVPDDIAAILAKHQ